MPDELQPDRIKKKIKKKEKRNFKVYGLPKQDLELGDVIHFRSPHYYAFVEAIERHEPKAGGQGDFEPSLPVFRIVFDCFQASWFDKLPNDPGQWPVANTVAQDARSRLMEFWLDEQQMETLRHIKGPFWGEIIPFEETTWWAIEVHDSKPSKGAYHPVTVILPIKGSDNPLTILFSGRTFTHYLVRLTVPSNLSKLIRFSHGWSIEDGLGETAPPYPGLT